MRLALNLLAAVSGGQLTRARAFLDRFERHAAGRELIVIKHPSILAAYTSTRNRRVIDIPIALDWLRSLRRMTWECRSLARLVRAQSADAYLSFSHYLPPINALGIPTIVGVSNLEPFSIEARADESFRARQRLRALRWTIDSAARRATRVVALSEACRGVLIGRGIEPRKIIVAPNGVDDYWGQPTECSRLLARLPIEKPFVLYVSHLHRYKNHLRLVEAYAQMPTAIRESHQLVIVGRPYDQDYFRAIKALGDLYGLRDTLVVMPCEGEETLRALYQTAKLFVFPSLIENSPNILLEAMMAGAPVASSNLAPMPEFCGEAAEYFDPLSVANICAKLQALLQNPALLQELRARAREQAGRFSWDEFVFRVLEAVDAAVAANRNRRLVA